MLPDCPENEVTSVVPSSESKVPESGVTVNVGVVPPLELIKNF